MIPLNDNIILLSDSYKTSHASQYPPKTQYVRSYFESRTGAKFPQTIFFGLQYFLKTYLEGQVVTKDKINEAEEVINLHLGQKIFNRPGWEYILNKYDGKLPVRLMAVAEGTPVDTSNVLMTLENTDPNFWLTNYLESLLVQAWYTSTICTRSREMKKIILHYLKETGTPEDVDFKLVDFGVRGTSCPEQAALGGAAHLVNFKATDNIPALMMARKFYNEPMAGFSIPASEHSTITSWGKEHEVDAMRNMLVQYPTGMVACVSDSFDIFHACSQYWGTDLKEMILARDGVLVIRPDSGDPLVVLPKVLEILADKFGFETNNKGYKVLNPKVRVIQGDGINIDSLEEILNMLKLKGWSADNIAFGSGGGLLVSGLDRDTQRFAFKCSSVTIDGVESDVYKSPITGGDKTSKRGRLKLIKTNGVFQTVRTTDPGENILQTVFENGHMVKEYNFSEIRENAKL